MEEIYEPLNKSLLKVGTLTDAAETHGILCGLLCTTQNFSLNEWFRHTLGETATKDGLASECQQQLVLIKNYTKEQLNSFNCEFMPLLPKDDIPLAERTQALGGWCEGFLFGLGLVDLEMDRLSASTKEFITDTISVSRVAQVEDNDELEEDYMQLVEYIRVGVMSLYEELTRTDKENGTN